MNDRKTIFVVVMLTATLNACGNDELVTVPESFPKMRVPEDNALTRERVELGKRLFFDERLSRTGEVSCASCHKQENAFADPRQVSEGVEGRVGTRNAPPLFNLAWNTSFFWDGGVKTLEQQVIGPIVNPLEMDMTMEEVVGRLSGDPSYVRQFEDAYDQVPSPEFVTKAMASFMRTMVSGDSRYDRFQAGDDAALNEAEKRGKELFFSERAECFHCHVGFNLTNNGFHNNGTRADDPDLGTRARHREAVRRREVQGAQSAQRGGDRAVHARRLAGDPRGRGRALREGRAGPSQHRRHHSPPRAHGRGEGGSGRLPPRPH